MKVLVTGGAGYAGGFAARHLLRAGDVPRLVAASELARNQPGRSPRYRELEAIIETAWAWHRANPSGYP